MSKSAEQKAFDVTLNEEKRTNFSHWISNQILNAESTRPIPVRDVQYWWTLYEQGLTRKQTSPWQDAADLTSYLGSEKVDALKARVMRTAFVDPFYTVEGWGQSASKAPFVEDFHQWALESEGLQAFMGRAVHQSLIEPRGVLEVFEDTTERVVRKNIRAQVVSTPDAPFALDGQSMEPVLAKDENGNYIEVFDDLTPSAEVTIDELQRVRKGPGYRVISYENFLVLPAHAREKADIWGYAKRFTRRMDQLEEAAKAGIYDKTAVEELHKGPDVTHDMTVSGEARPVADQDGPTAEKELWEVQFLHNLDGKGLRWYVCTVHVPTRTVLRLKHDAINMGRFILFVPYPRTDRAHEGYSFVGHKLITTIEEHTAWRNMIADRAANVIAAPIKRSVTALWDPDLQPMGPKAVIDVRDMNEIQAMDMPDLTGPAIQREQEIVAASERIAGMNDAVIGGSQTQGDSTLGEFDARLTEVFIRMDEVIKNIQEPLEDLGQIRHAIWVRTLKDCEKYNAAGLPAPGGLFDRAPKTLAQSQAVPGQFEGLDERGGDPTKEQTPQGVTSMMLEGTFRFKPRGSTDTADKARQRGDYMQGLQSLAILFKTWPALAMTIGMNPQAAKSAVEQWLRLFNIPDKQAWLGNIEQMMAPQGQPGMGMPQPGMGQPPMGGLPPQIQQMLGAAGPLEGPQPPQGA